MNTKPISEAKNADLRNAPAALAHAAENARYIAELNTTEVNPGQPLKIIVVGNGFDIELGLSTKYSDFIEDDLFNQLCAYEGSRLPKNGLPAHLKRVTTIQNWVDVENEIKEYALVLSQMYTNPSATYPAHMKSVSSAFYKELKDSHNAPNGNLDLLTHYVNNFIVEYKVLKMKFFDYLRKIMPSDSYYQLPKSILHEQKKSLFNFAYTINYTDTITAIDTENKFWIHGTLKDDSAILGIDDVSDLLPQFIPILKSTHPAYGKVNLSDSMQNAAEVHFFGLSFGDTDNAHFEPTFKYFATQQFYISGMPRGVQNTWGEPSKQKRKLVFHIYDQKMHNNTLNRLLSLTGTNLSGLRLNNEVIFMNQKTGEPI